MYTTEESSTDEECASTASSAQASRRSSASDSGVGCTSEYEPILQDTSGKERDMEGNNILYLETGAGHIKIEDEAPTVYRESCGGSSSAPSPMASLPLAGAVFGLCLGGPVGLMAGAKLGGVAAIGGSILGYAGASVIKEQKEMRRFMEEYKKKEQELQARETDTTTANTSIRPIARRGQKKTNLSPEARRRKRAQRQHKLAIMHPNSPGSEEKVCLKRQPPHLQLRHFRNMGDLSEEEQRSIVALIKKEDPVVETKTLIVTAIVCDAHTDNDATEDTYKSKKKHQEKVFSRTASLPAVLEEEQINSVI